MCKPRRRSGRRSTPWYSALCGARSSRGRDDPIRSQPEGANDPARPQFSAEPDSITRDVAIEGPGSPQLRISGDRRTRIFSIEGGAVRIAGLTLAGGISKGGDGAAGTGSAGGGGGAAGLGGAILLLKGSLVLDRVVFSGNQVVGGDGGSGGTGFGKGSGGAGGAPFTGEA